MVQREWPVPSELSGHEAERNKMYYILRKMGAQNKAIAALWGKSQSLVSNVFNAIERAPGGDRLEWEIKVEHRPKLTE